jgi:diacylglycerol kinase (CTP)
LELIKPLAKRSDPHVARRLWHIGGLLAMFCVDYFLPPAVTLKATAWVAGTLILLDLLRLRYPALNARLVWLFQPVLRESEKHKLTGSTYMLAGVAVVAYLFPRPVVLLTLLFFAFADPFAGYFGTRFGKDRLVGPKTLQGSLAAFIVCFFLAVIYCLAFKTMLERLVIVSLLGGLIGAVAELVPVGNLDDNFIFPVLSASMLTVVFMIFGGL